MNTEKLTKTHDVLKQARLTAIDGLNYRGQSRTHNRKAINAYFGAIAELNKAMKADVYLAHYYKGLIDEATQEAQALSRMNQSRRARDYGKLAIELGRFINLLER